MISSLSKAGNPSSFQINLGISNPSRTYQPAQQPIAIGDQGEKSALILLDALWRSQERFHLLGEMNKRNRQFRNIPAKTVDEAVNRSLRLSDSGSDAYFACAEYSSPESRTANNATGAFGFWMDIDCGEQKYAALKGYKTTEDALSAVKQFCAVCELPEPTHIVDSGGGLHVYWALDQVVDRNKWQAQATKLKSLTKAKGLLADDTRTADIASVLRVPGTLNYKYLQPRLVTLRYAAAEYVGKATMLNAIDSAYDKFCSTKLILIPVTLEKVKVANTRKKVARSKSGPVDIEKLASALMQLDPDCDEHEWALRRIAPMAGAAREYPALSKTLRELTRSWSSGELRGLPSRKWTTPGNNGRTGEEYFDEVWNRFLRSNYRGKRITTATIYFDADRSGASAGLSEGDI